MNAVKKIENAMTGEVENALECTWYSFMPSRNPGFICVFGSGE